MTNFFRRWIAFSMIGVLLMLSLCSCNSRDDYYDNYDYDDYYDDDYWADLEEEYVKNAAERALLKALQDGRIIHPNLKGYYPLNTEIDAEQYSFRVVSITGDSSSGWTVKGTTSLRDEFGNLCKAYNERDCYDYSLNFIIEVSSQYWGECVYLDTD